MRVIGKRSIASFLKIMIDVVWYAAIVLYSATFIFFIWMFFLSGPSYEVHGWPVNIQPSLEATGIRPATDDIEILEIVVDKAEIGFRTTGDWYPKAIRFASLLLASLLSLLIVYNLRGIIRSVVKSNPFTQDNVRRFRRIALLFAAITVFEAIRGTMIAIYIRSRFVTGDLNNPFKPLELGVFGDFLRSFHGHLIFVALAILVLGEIFRLGLEYKEDSQSIV